MFVVVKHDIKDAAAFQARGQAMVQDAPPALKPFQFYPDTVGKQAVCLWDGADLDTIRTYIDGKLGDSSVQEYFEVAAQYALGLPAAASR